MNLSYFISKRINREKQAGFSSTIYKIAVVSIGVGLGAAIVSFLVMTGFQDTVKNKIYGFNGHLIITKFTMSNSTEEQPINYHMEVYDHAKEYPFVRHVQEYAHKPGLIKSEDEVFGVLVKGVGKSFDVEGFRSNLLEGEFIHFPDSGYANQVVISKIISEKLRAVVGDQIIVHFFQNPPRLRRLTITGIYETHLSEYFDSKVIISDIRMIQRLNDWNDSLAGGLEVFIRDVNKIDDVAMAVRESIDFDYYVEPVHERYLQVFEWLNLLSRQVNILLGIILTVVSMNMISIILILVMERTQMIGILKALGSSDGVIRSIFIFNGIRLIVKGLLLGNLLGLGLAYLQYRFKIIELNAHDYYMSYVPVSWHWEIVALLNLLSFIVVTVVLLVPTMIIARIDPIKAIRFD